MHLDLLQSPFQSKLPRQLIFKQDELSAASVHIQELLRKGAIRECQFNSDTDFLSNIFLRPKHDGGFRLILNLKHFNQFVDYSHFKMESFNQLLDLMVQDCLHVCT